MGLLPSSAARDRLGAARGRGAARARRPRPLARARRADLDDLPGPAVGADARLHRRRPDRRGDPRATTGSAARPRARAPSSCSSWWGSRRPTRRAKAFPHEFSGGMRQRVMIAMAIVNDPAVLICDEPTTALDVTVQAQILDLLLRLREEIGMAILMITHDLGVIAGFADRVAVMYAGRLVESGPVHEVFERPSMPYTLGLLGAMPRVDATDRRPARADRGRPARALRAAPGVPVRAALPREGRGLRRRARPRRAGRPPRRVPPCRRAARRAAGARRRVPGPGAAAGGGGRPAAGRAAGRDRRRGPRQAPPAA